MTIFKKSKAVTRFTVPILTKEDGDSRTLYEVLFDTFNEFRLTEIPDGEDLSYGWTNFLTPFVPDFTDDSIITGNFVTVNLGINKKTVPAAALKREVYLMEQKEIRDKQIPKLGRATRALIKEAALKNLLAKAPTIPASVNMIWDCQEGEIYLLTTNTLAKNILEDIMLESFELQIRMVFPFTMGLESVDESVMSAIKPTVFV